MITIPKNQKALYLASNLGFSESGREFLYGKLIPLVERTGFFCFRPMEINP